MMSGRSLCALVPFLLLLAVDSAYADVYKWTDRQGRMHDGDTTAPQQPVQPLRTDQTDAAVAAA